MPQAEVGSKLIFENDQVQVCEFTVGPGEDIGAHTHEGGTLEVPRGTRVDEAALEAGKAHGARNIGATRYHEVLVELKAPR